MSSILIKGGNVWNGSSLSDADVLISDKKIKKIERAIADTADIIFDARGMTVLPGLVDAHVHLSGISSDEFGVIPESSSYPFGVTAVGEASAYFGDGELLDGYGLTSVVFVPVNIKDNRPNIEKARSLMKKYGKRAVGLKVYFDRYCEDIRDITPLFEICDFAHLRGLRVMVHTTNSPIAMKGIAEALACGDILSHAYNGSENNAMPGDFEALKTAKARGVFIDAALAGHMHTDFEIFRSATEHGFAPDIISTDITKYSAFTRGGRYGLTMCMSIARTLGMAEDDVFRAVTSIPARALGLSDRCGTLAPSRMADIAVLEYTDEPFSSIDKRGNRIFSDKGYRCRLTVRCGEVVYKD